MMVTVVLLNSLPLNALDWFSNTVYTIIVRKFSTRELREYIKFLKKEGLSVTIKCYIRHKATVELLKKILGVDIEVSSELYEYPGMHSDHIIFVITLKRPVRGQEVDNITESDIDIFKVIPLEGDWVK